MTQTPDKQDTILDAAFHAFASYGFRRTSMDDIARGAGLSRTALYLHFRSKEDIFRHLTQRFFAQAEIEVVQALSAPGRTAAETLHAALVAKGGKFMDVVLGTPHGAELMDAGFSIAGDIAGQGEARMHRLFADWLARRGVPDDLGTPDELTRVLMASIKGLKSGGTTLAQFRTGQARLARIFGRALDG